jgi:putative addiction module component (TIGR02574 family)
MTLQEIIDAARKLPRGEQLDLLDELYCMMNVDPDGVALTPAQAEDLRRRLDELEAGEAKLIPGDEAMEMLRKRRER